MLSALLAFLGETWLNDLMMDIAKMAVLALILFLPIRALLWAARIFDIWKWG